MKTNKLKRYNVTEIKKNVCKQCINDACFQLRYLTPNIATCTRYFELTMKQFCSYD